jgi:hypothetical protein
MQPDQQSPDGIDEAAERERAQERIDAGEIANADVVEVDDDAEPAPNIEHR